MAEYSPQTAAAFHVMTADRIQPLGTGQADWTRGLASLIDQEVHGRRQRVAHPRVQQLLARFGFEFEPASEPGQMRFQPPAAQMLRRAATYAEARARTIAADLGMPFDSVAGVNLIDGSAPLLRAYLRLIHGEEDLYGAEPYYLGAPRQHLLLRETSCVQKYSVARDWDPVLTPLPRCLFELSDSFRAEPEDDLQLSFRLRRFRLPEAHLHSRSLTEAVRTAERVHRLISADLTTLAGEVALLVSATDEFSCRHRDFLTGLTAQTGFPALLKKSPPGALCQDGVEVDVEYKLVDATGFARELSTFQIDELITRSVGVSLPDAPVTTIHTVPVGSVERFVFAAFDRVARIEAGGGRARLPLWLSPVAVRLAWDRDAHPPLSVVEALGDALEGHGLAVDVDDRSMPLPDKVASADAELVPLVLLLGPASTANVVAVRSFEDAATRTMPLAELLSDRRLRQELDVGRLPPTRGRLSARPVRISPPGSPGDHDREGAR